MENVDLFTARQLRQPRTSPPETRGAPVCNKQEGDSAQQSAASLTNAPAGLSALKTSNLSATAREFVPATKPKYKEPVLEENNLSYYDEFSLSGVVQEFLSVLSTSPGSFDEEVEQMVYMLNNHVTTEKMLKELVELIYSQSTTIPNFAYTGARLCNHLSHHLTINSGSGKSFRQLLLQRCQTEYEQRNTKVRGDEMTQKSFRCYVLFLGELYLNLEVRKAGSPPSRADILVSALKGLTEALFSNPVDGNLICANKLLKLTGSVLEDYWRARDQPDMDQLIQQMENVVLDASCSRDVKQMLLRLVELRSSNWGRLGATTATSDPTARNDLGAAAISEPTYDNDPNYFMNEPTFYTRDGTPFTAADPEFSEKYQEILDRQDLEEDLDNLEENFYDQFPDEDEMDPEIEEAFEKFCLESEKARRQ